MKYLKKADKTAESNVLEAQKVVHDMLANIDKNGEQAIIHGTPAAFAVAMLM